MFLKLRNIDWKTPVLESLFNKVASTNTGVFLWLLQNFWNQLFHRTPPVAAFGQIGFSPRFISIRHINTSKRCLTVHVCMKHWGNLCVRYKLDGKFSSCSYKNVSFFFLSILLDIFMHQFHASSKYLRYI